MVLVGGEACRKPEAQLPGDAEIVATVNGTHITRYDVEQAIERMLGEYSAAMDAQGRDKVVQSLVMSRAIALAREKELSDEQKLALERKVAVYREELLVKQYLAEHAPPEPVSAEMVEKYYREHLERFGATKQRSYEMIASERELNGAERDALLKQLVDPAAKGDWAAWAQQLRASGQPVGFTQGLGNESALHPKLRQVIESLSLGQASPVTFVQGRAYLLRLKGIATQAPKPLAEVSAQIRETLAPVQIKKALQSAGADVLKRSRVEYTR